MKLMVLGNGYSGKAIVNEFQKSSIPVEVYGRSGVSEEKKLDFASYGTIDRFRDILQKENFEYSIITFPVQNLNPEFLELLFQYCDKNILLGTTSIYSKHSSPVNENTDVLKNHERFGVEDYFIQKKGMLLRLSGIYGPARSPIRWIQKGFVKKSNKYINLIHVEDIARVIIKIIGKGLYKNEVYNLSDGASRTWREIFQFLEEKNVIPHTEESLFYEKSAWIDNSKIRNLLGHHEFLNFQDEVLKLVDE